jgi:hypothetical protein
VELKPTRHKYYQNKHITNVNYTTVICIILLLLSGDVSLNLFTPEVELVGRLSFGAFDTSFISIKNESLKSGK